MAKKDLKAAAAKGADLFFSAANEQNAQYTLHTQDIQDTPDIQDTLNAQPVLNLQKAQDMQPAELAQTVLDMEQAIITQEQERAQRKEARKAETAARHAAKKRFNVEISRESYDYLAVMAGITGVSVNRFLSDLIDREAATNSATYTAAKELIQNARKG